MKILHTADWHIGPFPGPEKDGVNLREQDTYACIEALIETAREEQPDVAVISGDIFHTAKVWSNRALQEAHKARTYIEELSQICTVVVLYGTPNHDLPEQFVILADHFDDNPCVIISMYPQRYVLHDAGHKGEKIQVCTLPGFDRGVFRAKFPGLSREEENQVFTEELNNIVMGLKAQCDPSIPSILVTHYTVPGCNMESGQTAFFSQAEPVILPETIAAADFDLVALGHIHKPQPVTGCHATFYAGAVNALNFNDEGQERGFYIHTLPCDKNTGAPSSFFYTTPYRKFITIHMSNEDVEAFNNGGQKIIYAGLKPDDVIENRIVRVLYSCTDENHKALNKAALEKELYAGGAFWVSEIIPTDISESTVKEEFVDDNTPLDNLRDYLAAKGYAESDARTADIISAARPIIDEAISIGTVSRYAGVFEPLEIEVTNYRNYEAETFNFKDITFCTINGTNGAGKSSLFMDAILDCLYEEPREGELTGWIRNSEEIKSGSITFTFKIGDKTFRVARTRAKKSGKATLNLAELIDGEWLNRSKEKAKDTQEEIVNILGMDSLTFKSCALIMQDQYGIFLQSDKEDRMTVLGSLLGLGAYEDMEAIAKLRLADANKQISQIKSDIEKLSGSVAEKDNIEVELAAETETLAQSQESISIKTIERDALQVRLNTKLEADSRALLHLNSINALEGKKRHISNDIETQRGIITNAETILAEESEILTGVAGHAALLEQEKTFISGKATYEAKQREQRTHTEAVTAADKSITTLKHEKAGLAIKQQPLAATLSKETELAEQSARYLSEKEKLAELEKGAEQYIELSTSIETGEKAKTKLKSAFDVELAERVATYRGYEEKAKLLDNAGCVDVENAKCKFLTDAQNVKAVMGEYQKKCTAWKEAQLAEIQKYQIHIDGLTRKRDAIGYDPVAIKALRTLVSQLEALHMEYEKLTSIKEQIRLIDERTAAIDGLLIETEKSHTESSEAVARIMEELTTLKKAADEYDALKLKIMVESKWLEKEKMLPVAREQKATAEKRLDELNKELVELTAEIEAKQKEYNTEMETATGSEELQRECDTVNATLGDMQTSLNKTNERIGGLRQKLTDIEKKASEIKELKKRVNEYADQAVIYEELKHAFSQDGIPHNIIRSIVPMLAAKANSILGQMTGGRMGLEFATDKVLKSNKKEVVTLDILIEEYGQGKLPYLSKSGGEKVKAALSAILALAEIKTTRSGIQLGMLFIDEPPFLDGDGMQAYCDALEAIQQRYNAIKIMAITHDPAMKARFPQSIDVVKTEMGSKVVIG